MNTSMDTSVIRRDKSKAGDEMLASRGDNKRPPYDQIPLIVSDADGNDAWIAHSSFVLYLVFLLRFVFAFRYVTFQFFSSLLFSVPITLIYTGGGA